MRSDRGDPRVLRVPDGRSATATDRPDPFLAAGNQAVCGVLDPAGAQPDGPSTHLGPAALADPAALLGPDAERAAVRYYHLPRYDAALVNALRSRLVLPPGGADTALVRAVARYQYGENLAGHPIRVDGKAGPDTHPRLFPDGMNVPGTASRFGDEALSEVFDAWAALLDADGRGDRLSVVLNERLSAAGVPMAGYRVVAGVGGTAGFDPTDWALVLDRTVLEQPEPGDAAAGLADAVFHAGRRAEHVFTTARQRAGAGDDAAAVRAGLGVPAEVAARAVADPAARTGNDAIAAGADWTRLTTAAWDQRDRTLSMTPGGNAARAAGTALADAALADAALVGTGARAAAEPATYLVDGMPAMRYNLPAAPIAVTTVATPGATVTVALSLIGNVSVAFPNGLPGLSSDVDKLGWRVQVEKALGDGLVGGLRVSGIGTSQPSIGATMGTRFTTAEVRVVPPDTVAFRGAARVCADLPSAAGPLAVRGEPGFELRVAVRRNEPQLPGQSGAGAPVTDLDAWLNAYGPVLAVVGAVALIGAAVALIPETGGASLALLGV